MGGSLPFSEYVDVVRRSGEALAAAAADAGFAAPVPTCPAWTVRDLLAHQAMVHRWAAANVRGEDPASLQSPGEVVAHEDLAGHYLAGLDLLIDALRSAPPDLRALTFLNDVADPRTFWARRQAHETTVHAVDALAAALGRVPTAAQTGITPEVALDGLDELLRGFFTRGTSKLFDGTARTMSVEPVDAPRGWRLHLEERLTVDDDVTFDHPADVTLRGTTAALYLALWNRGDEIEVSGDAAIVQRWRETQRIRWS